MSSLRKKKILFVNSMNFRQRQVKEALTALNRQSNILIKIRTKVCSNRKENTFYGNYYSNGTSSIKLGMPKTDAEP